MYTHYVYIYVVYTYIHIKVHHNTPIDAYVYPKFPTTTWVNHIGVLKFICASIRHWGVEAWPRFRPNFDTGGGGRSLVEISTKLRHPTCRNFDQTSTPPVSKFGRSLLGVSMKHIGTLIYFFYQTATPNFDQTSTLGVSRLVEISTELRPPCIGVWSKFRPNFDPPVSKFGRNFDKTSARLRQTL